MAKKLKGKKWYTLIAPQMFNKKVIGKTPAGDPKTLIGREIDVNLVNLIDDMSKYYMKFYFKIKKIEEDKAYTEFSGFKILRDYISRSIRYGIERIDTVQDLEIKDGKKVRVKTIIITSKKIKKNVKIDLKKFVKDELKKQIEDMKLDKFIKSIINDTLKNLIFNKGNKIYPIRMFEIRKVEIK